MADLIDNFFRYLEATLRMATCPPIDRPLIEEKSKMERTPDNHALVSGMSKYFRFSLWYKVLLTESPPPSIGGADQLRRLRLIQESAQWFQRGLEGQTHHKMGGFKDV